MKGRSQSRYSLNIFSLKTKLESIVELEYKTILEFLKAIFFIKEDKRF